MNVCCRLVCLRRIGNRYNNTTSTGPKHIVKCYKRSTRQLPQSITILKNILTWAGYTCTAFRCTTPVHLYYTCFTPPNSYQFFGLGRKYHLLFYLVRQFPCLRLKITTWWYNIEVLDYIFFFFVVNFYNSGYHKH